MDRIDDGQDPQGGEGITDEGGLDPSWNEPVHMPELTPEEKAAWDAEQAAAGGGPEQPRPFKFKHGDREFASEKELGEYIDGLAAGGTQPQGDEGQFDPEAFAREIDERVEARIEELLERIQPNRENGDRRGGRQPRGQEARGAAVEEEREENPFDPDADPDKHQAWEGDRKFKRAVQAETARQTASLQERVDHLEGNFTSAEQQRRDEATLNTFDRTVERAMKEVGVDPNVPPEIRQLLLDSIAYDKDVNKRGMRAVRSATERIWKQLQSYTDRKAQALVKAGERPGGRPRTPPSVITGAQNSIVRRRESEEKFTGSLRDSPTQLYLRRRIGS